MNLSSFSWTANGISLGFTFACSCDEFFFLPFFLCPSLSPSFLFCSRLMEIKSLGGLLSYVSSVTYWSSLSMMAADDMSPGVLSGALLSC